jgi:3-oxoacyl-[acyl-carrier protein] reductase
MLLEGKTALVTGAARGIGRAIAETFAAQGASLILVDINEQIHQVEADLASQDRKVIAFQCDVCDEAKLRELLKLVRQRLGHLDVLVNNAGVLYQGVLGMSSMEAIRQMLEVNITALMNLTQYSIRLASPHNSLSIINLASIAGTQGMEGVAAYSASKGAVVSFTLAGAKELARRGIRMNAIAPGFIDTDMTRQLSPDWHQELLASVRFGRIGTPQDVANCALFLASDLSSYITGQVVGVDGGMAV